MLNCLVVGLGSACYGKVGLGKVIYHGGFMVAEVRTDVEKLFDMIGDAEPGTVFPYAAFAEVLQEGRDSVVTKNVIYTVVRRLNIRLQEERQRTLVVVRNVGYRVLFAKESVAHAKRHEKRAANQIVSGVRVLRHTRVDELDAEQRKVLQDMQIRMSHCEAVIQQLASRMARRERDIEMLQTGQDAIMGEQHATENAMQMFMKQTIERIEKLEKEKGA